MARKRMFDNDIINQDSFLDLPTETKALYFLLGMEADDEGFVSPKRVMRLHGISEDNLKILIAKQYVIKFETGVVVITDWKRNNYLDKNKIKPTIYVDEKKLLNYDEIKQQYTLNPVNSMVKPKLNQSLTEVKQKFTQNSIEEYSIEENRIVGEDEKATAEITKFFQDNIGTITPTSAELLFSYLDDFDDYKIIIEAIKKSALANKRNTNYINGILKSWKNKGYKVLKDLDNETKQKESTFENRTYKENELDKFYA